MATKRKPGTEENKDSAAFLKAYASYFASVEGGSQPDGKDLDGIICGNTIQGSRNELLKLLILHVQTSN